MQREDAHCHQLSCLGLNRYATSSGGVHNKAQIKERLLVQAPLNYAWNPSRWTSLSKCTIVGGQLVMDHVRTSLEN